MIMRAEFGAAKAYAISRAEELCVGFLDTLRKQLATVEQEPDPENHLEGARMYYQLFLKHANDIPDLLYNAMIKARNKWPRDADARGVRAEFDRTIRAVFAARHQKLMADALAVYQGKVQQIEREAPLKPPYRPTMEELEQEIERLEREREQRVGKSDFDKTSKLLASQYAERQKGQADKEELDRLWEGLLGHVRGHFRRHGLPESECHVVALSMVALMTGDRERATTEAARLRKAYPESRLTIPFGS